MSIHQKRLLIGLTNGINNNNMKPQHQLITFAALCLLLIIGLNHCAKDKPKTIPFDYKSEAEMMKKQFGIEQAILLNQLEAANRRLQTANNAKDSIRKRELSLTNTNIALMKKLRDRLPKECDTVFVLCDEIINVKDSSYAALFNAFQLCADGSNIKDSLITNYKAENVTDSTLLVISKQETKQQRRGKVAAWCVGGAMFILWLVVGLK
jgi:hypothetical protein